MTESNSTSFTKPELPMTIQTIREYLPHRYPFLLVDRVVDVTENGIVAYKNVSINEEFLQGHFPNYPIMPGVLIVEALAQVSGILGFIITMRNQVKVLCSCSQGQRKFALKSKSLQVTNWC